MVNNKMNFSLKNPIIGLLFFFVTRALTDEQLSPLPDDSNSTNQTILVEQGGEIKLPCPISKHKGSEDVVQWMKDKAILFLNKHLFNPNNTNMKLEEEDFTLVISNFSSNLNANYICRLGVDPRSTNTYFLRVKEPPQVQSIEGDTLTEVGDDFNLKCKTSGFPAPNVTWYRQKSEFLPKQNIHNDSSISFENINLDFSGIYICVASYEEIQDSKSVQVTVVRGLEAESRTVYAEPSGIETKLCCLLNKTKELLWMKQEKIVTLDERISEEASEHKHCLVVKQVEQQDLGTYLCQTNNLRQISTIDLEGIPKPPILVSSYNYSMTWKVFNSAFPVRLYSIYVKPSGSNNETWECLLHDKITNGGNEFLISHTFSKLSPGKYDVKLEVKNKINHNRVTNFDALTVVSDISYSVRNSADHFAVCNFCVVLITMAVRIFT